MALKVVHLAASVGAGGAAVGLLNLHKGLRQIGLDSSILAGKGATAGTNSVRIIRNPFEGMNQLVYRELVYPNRTPLSNTLFSFDTGGILLNSEREVLEADVIQLHWVANFLTSSSLSALASLGKPIVWTLHDMRPFTGGCHYSAGCKGFRFECQSCPQLLPDLYPFPARAHMAQTDVVRLLQPVFVAPSQWLANECISSSVASSCSVEVIPYGIDAKAFAPMPQQEARRRLGLDPKALYIMLGAHSLAEQRKGGILAQQTLSALAKDEICAEIISKGEWRVVSCGAEAFPIDAPWRAEHLGFLPEQDMALLYAACDVLLFTSQEDNLPNMILEAMACSLPVVANPMGGVPELVEDGKSGYLADPFDPCSLCEHLKTILKNAEPRQEMGQNARTVAATGFTLDVQARRYRDLYARLIGHKSEAPRPISLVIDSNTDSFDLTVNALEQERNALLWERNALLAEKNALRAEKYALENASLAEKNALKNQLLVELARQKSDARSELSRLRRWNRFLRKESLSGFISRNIRLRWRWVRKLSRRLRKSQGTS